ncbi:chloride channel protein 2-like [Armigeres subalbatus]|uniref:chloride channel protein 2-like n=1 Tax=Armigeres subalbatus TaxID=124917 RepID=UPI002ED22DEE
MSNIKLPDEKNLLSPAPSIVVTRQLSSSSDASATEDGEEGMGYTPTLMYGRYTKDLGRYARKLSLVEQKRRENDKARYQELLALNEDHSKCFEIYSWLWRKTFARLGEDWVILALLGTIMALLSHVLDKGIAACVNARMWIYHDLTDHPVEQFFAWVSMSVCMVLFSAGFVHLVAPQAIGSGIPEMKTIIRGVALKNYLTFRTLVAKLIGLVASLGSGMPIGKEGPFVHISSIVSQLLSKFASFKSIYANESHNTDMLVAACGVGVAACFASPVGGVLYSIEVTTSYFAVRNYWRGFFGSICGAAVFQLLAIWFTKVYTVTALFPTSFEDEFPFGPLELFVFALMGAVAGLGGALFVWLHRKYVLFIRGNKRLNKFLQLNRFLYPTIISFIVASLLYPRGPGQFIAGGLDTHHQIHELFSNFTWSQQGHTVEQAEIISNWRTDYTSVLVNLALYLLFQYTFSIICTTLPVPSGMFIPMFKIGSGYGRLVGEAMAVLFPVGIGYAGKLMPIIPGGYAVVGAAAFAGAVSHSVSVGVMVLEMTGQITHFVPVMVASLISNWIAALLQPSLYESYIQMKNLPYLPDIMPNASGMYNIFVEDFMVRDVKFIWKTISYQKLKKILKLNKELRCLPIVESPENPILLGSVQRYDLIQMLDKHVGRKKRLEVAARWLEEEEERLEQEQRQREEDEARLQRSRRPSRFEVSPALDVLELRTRPDNEMLQTQAREGKSTENSRDHTPQSAKSILKKTNSLPKLRSHSPADAPYSTITGGTVNRIRSVLDVVFRKSGTLQDVNHDPEVGSNGMLGTSKKVHLPRERIIDMSIEEQKTWEREEMAKPIDIDNIPIDPAPFQLVERTSMLKVHSLFAMASINLAYVTNIGKLVGVVALKELRHAVQDVNNGTFTAVSSKHEQDKDARAMADRDKNQDDSSSQEPLLSKEDHTSSSESKEESIISFADDSATDLNFDRIRAANDGNSNMTIQNIDSINCNNNRSS